MKILYAIQGTGNGHLSRARDIIPVLQQKGELDILVSGTQADVDLGYEVKYKFEGLSFIFGKKGGVDIIRTYQKNRVKRLLREIKSLPVEKYDIVINDFEPVSAWACFIKHKPCVGLSHQAAILNRKAPQPKNKNLAGIVILKYYAPTTVQYGFHFQSFGKNIFTPVIRKEIRELEISDKGHYTVYLPAYDDKRIIKILSLFKDIPWEVFSKHNKKPVSQNNIVIHPVSNEGFMKSMASAKGVLCGAGFETPAEVMYLKKKLMVIPMKGQYEQQCNAATLKDMGVAVIKSLKKKHAPGIQEWLSSEKIVAVSYPDITSQIIDTLLQHYPASGRPSPQLGKNVNNPKKFREYTFKKIFSQSGG